MDESRKVSTFQSLPITIGLVLVIVSGLTLALGMRALSLHEKMSQPADELSIEEFFSARPENAVRFRLTDFQPGAGVYPDPIREDGQWEKVYVCLFPNNMRRLPKNYISVIAEFEGVTGANELSELLAEGEIEFYFWPNKQNLPVDVYNRMAVKYRGMKFSHCLIGKSGGPPSSPDFGHACIMLGFAGIVLSFVVLIAYFFAQLLLSIFFHQSEPWWDENEAINNAGLPSLDAAAAEGAVDAQLTSVP